MSSLIPFVLALASFFTPRAYVLGILCTGTVTGVQDPPSRGTPPPRHCHRRRRDAGRSHSLPYSADRSIRPPPPSEIALSKTPKASTGIFLAMLTDNTCNADHHAGSPRVHNRYECRERRGMLHGNSPP